MNTQNVWVVEYEHKHGKDVLVFESEKAAWLGVVNIMLDWIGDIQDPEEQNKIISLLVLENYEEACSHWYEDTEESFVVTEQAILPAQDTVRERLLKEAK